MTFPGRIAPFYFSVSSVGGMPWTEILSCCKMYAVDEANVFHVSLQRKK